MSGATFEHAVELQIGFVDVQARTVFPHDGSPLRLTVMEADLFAYLFARPGQTVPRTELLAELWGYGPRVVTRADDHAMKRLRAKVEISSSPRHLITVRGEGFRFEPIRRVSSEPAPPVERALLRLDACTVDLGVQQARMSDGSTVAISTTEASLLHALAEASGTTVPRDKLRRKIHGQGAASDAALAQLVFRLRAKLERDPSRPQSLLTARGTGYRLVLREDKEGFHHPSIRTNVSPRPRRMIGRDSEVAEAEAALTGPARVITLHGVAGVGKTHLAHELALSWAERESRFAWAWTVTRGATVDEVVSGVAHAMGTRAAPKSPARELGLSLRLQGGVLLILDGLEQSIEACMECMSEWLATAPNLRVLVTSRVATRHADEALLSVAPLTLPRADEASEEKIGASPAVQFFLDRADLTMQSADASTVRDIARDLDGLPLALELAAGRASMLGMAEIHARIARRFELLAVREPGVGVRSLKAALDWSWDMLDPQERSCLAQLSVFVSGFSLAAAEAVVELQVPVIDAVHQLLEHSLVHSSRGASAKLMLLESVRDYAAGQLAAEGVAAVEGVTRRHIDYMAHLGRRPRGKLGSVAYWVLRNAFVAANKALDQDDDESAAACLWGMRQTANNNGLLTEVHPLMARLLERDRLGHESLAKVRVAMARLEATRGNPSRSTELLEQVLDMRPLEAEVESMCLGDIGGRWRRQGRHDDAEAAFSRAAALLEGNSWSAVPLQRLALLTRDRGRPEEARALYEKAIAVCIDNGDVGLELRVRSRLLGMKALHGAASLEEIDAIIERHVERGIRNNMGKLLLFRGGALISLARNDEAMATFEQAATWMTERGERWSALHARCNVAILAVNSGQPDRARPIIDQMLAVEDTDRVVWGRGLALLGVLEAREGHHERAKELIDQAERLTREANNLLQLGSVLCWRTEVDRLGGRDASAAEALNEAEEISIQMGLTESSYLGREVAKLGA